ncbi:MAG: hypothetical protein HC913_06975 [Microscillaceae bacterium]|nr:hypothetical protein [Microscillaceae bacterium]
METLRASDVCKVFFLWLGPSLLLLVSLSSCELECENPSLQVLRLQVFKAGGIEPDTLAFLDVRGTGALLAQPDSLLYTQADTLSIFSLPLSPFSDTSRFVFRRLLAGGDTLTYRLGLIYERRTFVERPDCGLQVSITDLRLLESDFFDTTLLSPDISNDTNQIHLRLVP